MLIEYFTLVEESQGAEFETRDVEVSRIYCIWKNELTYSLLFSRRRI